MTDFKIIAESNADEFIQYLNQVEHGFVYMIQTMMDVAQVVKENTLPKTPFRTGKLGRSFKPIIVTDNSRMKVVEVRMSALNERTGYDYAMTQHRGYHRAKTKYGYQYVYYHQTKDISPPTHGTLGDKVYKAHGWSSDMIFHSGMDQYLYWGILDSEEGAYQMIEEDYLSLFRGGYIY